MISKNYLKDILFLFNLKKQLELSHCSFIPYSSARISLQELKNGLRPGNCKSFPLNDLPNCSSGSLRKDDAHWLFVENEKGERGMKYLLQSPLFESSPGHLQSDHSVSQLSLQHLV